MVRTRGVWALLTAMVALPSASGCSKPDAGGTTSATPAVDWNARVRAAAAAFPAGALPTCGPVEGRVLVFGGGAGTSLEFCPSFGDSDTLRDYRPTDSLDWRGKHLAAAKKILFFSPTKQVAPDARGASAAPGGTLTPGVLEGRAVLFSLDAVPECELSIKVSGPLRASSTPSESVDSVAKRALCGDASAAIRKALSK